MSGVATAIGVSAIVGAGAAKYASDAQAKSAREARKAAGKATDRAIDTELEMYYQARDDLAPWREAGANALSQLYGKKVYGLPEPVFEDFETQEEYDTAYQAYENSASFEPGLIQDPSGFDPTTQPGYQFGYEKFIREPYEQAAAAGGKRLSGQTLKDLTRYASDYGETKYQNYLSNLYNVTGMGQASAAGSAQLSSQTGSNIAGNILYGGSQQAAGYINQGNAQAQGIAGIAGAGQNALQSYMDYKILWK